MSDPTQALEQYRDEVLSGVAPESCAILDEEVDGDSVVYRFRLPELDARRLDDLRHALELNDWADCDGNLVHEAWLPTFGCFSPREAHDALVVAGTPRELQNVREPEDAETAATRAALPVGAAFFLGHVGIVFGVQEGAMSLIAAGVVMSFSSFIVGLAVIVWARRPSLRRATAPAYKPMRAEIAFDVHDAVTIELRIETEEPDPVLQRLLQREFGRFVE